MASGLLSGFWKMSNNHECYDHLGNKFPSIVAMCKHYNIERASFNSRIKNHWPLEKALTAPVKHVMVIDPENGLEIPLHELYRSRNLKYATYYKRNRKGMSDDYVLFEGKLNSIPCGNDKRQYKSIRQAAKEMGVNYNSLQKRISKGYDFDVPSQISPQYPAYIRVKDHTGEVFNSITDMCEKWGVPLTRFRRRILCGWKLEYALTVSMLESRKNGKQYRDHKLKEIRSKGNWYDCLVV